MTSSDLENLANAGKLKRELPSQAEFEGLMKLGEAKLRDAQNQSLALESRFDLAYSASHSYALAALRWRGYRSDQRYLVFQTVEHTLGLPPGVWRVLDKCHGVRNIAEYEGHLQINEQLVKDLLAAATRVRDAVWELGPVPQSRV